MSKKKAPKLAGDGAEEKTLDVDVTTGESGEQLPDEDIVERMREQSADFGLSQDEIDAMKNEFDQWAADAPDYKVALEHLAEMRKEGPLRVYWFIIYPESCNPEWVKLLVDNGLRGVISPLHCNDEWPDGRKKKPHWHVILTYEGKKSRKQVQAIVDACGGVRLETVENLTGAVRYLCHLDILPDKIASDKGKAKYSVDDLVPFGGFDPMPHIKATQSQVAEGIKEMQIYIDRRDFIYWDDFVRMAYAEHPEWAFVMARQSSMWIVKQFLQARHDRRAEAHVMMENAALRAKVEEMLAQVDRVLAFVKAIVTGEVDTDVASALGAGDDDDDDE